ncbi:efflux RND transporter periplasmic adaptor subunit [Aquimonas voraii]|uniref:HlyD family secretion protein n=1 Tax=Aquimonas voraii TaxID=265719 RepID=A0A1G6T730_9GAMM|nr:efflux RND transporter periplasmic adaptor subunit [Aquimonas voraii]SDD24888.1 HlyD family secretion protein [Aquimonas voraii]
MNSRPAASRRFRPALFLYAAIFASVLGGIYYWTSRSGGTALSYKTVPLARGDLRVAISATGALKALSTVDIGSQVSGQIQEVLVDFNDRVSRDQIIARLDPANYQARLTQTRAALASARASLQEALAAQKNAEADFARKQELVGRQLVSRADLDLAIAAREQAVARVASARAQIEQAEANVADAELDLDYTVIRSPVDGVVLSRTAEPGQTVAASFQSPVLFQIAEDLSQMQIELSVDESDVGQIRAGQPVKFTVDAFAGRDFRGEVRQVRLAAVNTQNVITYPVIIAVENPDFSLLPGMTANASIEVSERRGVLRVPNAALRYKPADAPAENPMARMFGGGNLADELARIADGLELNPTQRAAFDADAAAARERAERMRQQIQQRMAQGGAGGAPMFTMSSGGPSQAQIAAGMTARIRDGYAGFLATLDADQRERFDAQLNELANARAITVYVLRDGKPEPVQTRAGLSDSSHTEIVGSALAEGEAIITGSEGGA